MCRKPKTKAFKKQGKAKKVGASKTRNAGKDKKNRRGQGGHPSPASGVQFKSLKVQGMPKMKALEGIKKWEKNV